MSTIFRAPIASEGSVRSLSPSSPGGQAAKIFVLPPQPRQLRELGQNQEPIAQPHSESFEGFTAPIQQSSPSTATQKTVSATAVNLPEVNASESRLPEPESHPHKTATLKPIDDRTLATNAAYEPHPVPQTPIKPHAIQTKPDSPKDKEWSRLELITRLHREKESAANTPEAQPDFPQQTQSSEIDMVQRQGTTDTAVSQPPSTSSLPGQGIIDGDADTAVPKPTDTAAQTHPQQPMIQKSTMDTAAPQPTSTTPPPNQEIVDGDADTAVPNPTHTVAQTHLPQPMIQKSSTDTAAPQPPDRPETNHPVEYEEDSNAASTSSPVQQVLPLQAVWPTEQLQMSPEGNETTPEDFLENRPSRATLENNQIQKRLSDVPTGKPTDSSIPLMHPGRPRPTRSRTPAISPMEDSGQRKPMEKSTEKPVVDADSLNTSQSLSPQTVPTQIGNLPSDLWEIIGETPPIATTQTPNQSNPQANDVVHRSAEPTTFYEEGMDTAVSSNKTSWETTPDLLTELPTNSETTDNPPAASETASLQPPTLMTPITHAFVQREEENNETATTETAVAREETTEGDQAGEGEKEKEEEIDEISRKVYQEIKRRLSIEWERTRGRFSQ